MQSTSHPRLMPLALALALVAGCDSQGDLPHPRTELCDGSADVTLSVRIGGGFVGELYEFMYPLGDTFLVVDGKCNAWSSIDAWTDLRLTKLSSEEADALSDAFRVSSLQHLSGRYTDTGCADGATSEISDGHNKVSCYCGCRDDGTPRAVREVDARARDEIEALWKRSETASGALRVAVIQDPRYEERDVYMVQSWPLTRDIRSLLEPEIPDANGGMLIEAGEDAAALRALRDEYARQGRLSDDNAIPIESDDGEVYGLLMRDELPAPALELVDR